MDDDVLKRLGAVETAVSETKVQVGAIAVTLPHLATKADLKGETGELKAEIRAVETSIITWIIGIIIATAGLAFTIAKFVH